jgi:hypothetical protein
MFLLFLLLIPREGREIVSKSSDFYYERDFELIETIYDLQALSDPIKNLIEHADFMSSSTFANTKIPIQLKFTKDGLISEVINSANSTLNEIEYLKGFIAPPGSTRSKKAIPLVGELWHQISGSPGPWEYRKSLEMVAKIEQALALTQNQTKNEQKQVATIEAITKDEQTEISQVTRAVKSLANRYDKEQDAGNALALIMAFRSKANKVILNINKKVTDLYQIVEAAKNGKPSIKLISRQALRNQIERMQSRNEFLAPVFGPKETGYYFAMPIVKMVWSNKKLHVYIRIPLVDFSRKYEISPIDALQKENRFDYILSSKNRKLFRLIKAEELEKCIKIGNSFISNLRVVESQLHELTCNLLGCRGTNSNGPIAITEITTTTFSYTTDQEFHATLLCHTSHRAVKMPSSGFITIPTICTLTSNLFTIDQYPTQSTFSTKKAEYDFSVTEFKDTVMIKEEKLNLNLTDLSKNITKSWKKMDQLQLDQSILSSQVNKKITEITNERKTLQAAMYGGFGGSALILIIMLIAVIICFCKICKRIPKLN